MSDPGLKRDFVLLSSLNGLELGFISSPFLPDLLLENPLLLHDLLPLGLVLLRLLEQKSVLGLGEL